MARPRDGSTERRVSSLVDYLRFGACDLTDDFEVSKAVTRFEFSHHRLQKRGFSKVPDSS